MGKSLPQASAPTPDRRERPDRARSGFSALDRLASFRITYVAIVAFVFLSVFSVKVTERALQAWYELRIAEAVDVDWRQGPVTAQIRERVVRLVRRSPWVGWGGVRVDAVVLGADGTPIFMSGLGAPPPPPLSPEQAAREADRVLPVSATVTVGVPYNALVANAFLVLYAGILLQLLYLYQRRVARHEASMLSEAESARADAAGRAARIESELEEIQDRLSEVSTSESEHAREIDGLRLERASLQEKLAALAERERELIAGQADAASTLDEERQALEDLLDEALEDVRRKEEAIDGLESRLKRASKDEASRKGRAAREAEWLGRRLRTLYKNLELDDRAVEDLVGLRDESMKLRAEEGIKRLSDDVETAGARRKVGGLPPGLPVFELGFAGKGRLYYTTGTQRRLRILCVGAKNTQKTDLEYLSRIVTRT